MKLKSFILAILTMVISSCLSMNQNQLINVVEDIVAQEEISVSYLERLTNHKFYESDITRKNVLSMGEKFTSYESKNPDIANYRLRIKKNEPKTGILVITPKEKSIKLDDILSRLEKIDYIITPNLGAGTETLSYKIESKEMFFEFDAASELLNYVSIHF